MESFKKQKNYYNSAHKMVKLFNRMGSLFRKAGSYFHSSRDDSQTGLPPVNKRHDLTSEYDSAMDSKYTLDNILENLGLNGDTRDLESEINDIMSKRGLIKSVMERNGRSVSDLSDALVGKAVVINRAYKGKKFSSTRDKFVEAARAFGYKGPDIKYEESYSKNLSSKESTVEERELQLV